MGFQLIEQINVWALSLIRTPKTQRPAVKKYDFNFNEIIPIG